MAEIEETAQITQENANRVYGRPFTSEGNTGRPKGVPNRLTKTVKETVLAVFNELQSDPNAKLIEWARKEPTEFYKIASKLIPTEITGTVKQVIVVTDLDE